MRILGSVLLLVCMGLSTVHGQTCSDLLRNLEVRSTLSDTLDWDDDISYLRHFRKTRSMGVMTDSFDSELNTRIYHGNTALVDRHSGVAPFVDPRARGLFVFIHGSGTMAASGRNFNSLMNLLHAHNFAGLSFDLPYHMDGPVDQRFEDPAYFMSWIKRIIDKYRVPGMPVYLIGHSYGADVIPEFLSRHPYSVQGGLSVSLVNFNEELTNWYLTKTSKMNFGETMTNHAADAWADAVGYRFQWKTGRRQFDPTILNPELSLRVLAGNWEEYVPGPVGGPKRLPVGPNTYDYRAAVHKLLRGAEVIVEDNVGHYIFEKKDEFGMSVILREMLLVARVNPRTSLHEVESAAVASSYPLTESLMQKYSSDVFFKKWIDKTMGFSAFIRLMDKDSEKLSRKLHDEYEVDRQKRESEIVRSLEHTEKTAPSFWAKYKESILAGKPDASILLAYANLVF